MPVVRAKTIDQVKKGQKKMNNAYNEKRPVCFEGLVSFLKSHSFIINRVFDFHKIKLLGLWVVP